MWKYGYSGQKYALVFRENAPPRTARYRISYFFLVLAPQAPTQSPIDPVPGSPRAPATSRCRNTATAPKRSKTVCGEIRPAGWPVHSKTHFFWGAGHPARTWSATNAVPGAPRALATSKCGFRASLHQRKTGHPASGPDAKSPLTAARHTPSPTRIPSFSPPDLIAACAAVT